MQISYYGFKYVFIHSLRRGQNVTQGQFLIGVNVGLNSEFPFPRLVCLTKSKEPSKFDFLPIAEWVEAEKRL